jgi:hypothetical protein
VDIQVDNDFGRVRAFKESCYFKPIALTLFGLENQSLGPGRISRFARLVGIGLR